MVIKIVHSEIKSTTYYYLASKKLLRLKEFLENEHEMCIRNVKINNMNTVSKIL